MTTLLNNWNIILVFFTLITLYIAYRRVCYWRDKLSYIEEMYNEVADVRDEYFNLLDGQEVMAKMRKIKIDAQEETIKELQTKLIGTQELASYWEDLYLAKLKMKVKKVKQTNKVLKNYGIPKIITKK